MSVATNQCLVTRGLLSIGIVSALAVLTAPCGLGQTVMDCAQAPPGLVAWWPADGNANDLVWTNHGTLQNGTTFAAGLADVAFQFDGINDQIATVGTSLTNIQNTFTLQFWVYPASGRTSTAESTAGAAGNSSQRYAIAPEHGGSGTAKAGVGVSVGTNGISVFEHAASYLPALLVANLPIHGWTQITVVYENKRPSLYVNGSFIRQGLTSSRGFVYPSKSFGNVLNYGPYAGLLDEVAIFDHALTTNEIAALYLSREAGMCKLPQPPAIGVSPQGGLVALGSNATSKVIAGGTPPLNYQWLFHGTNLPGATDPALTISNAQLQQSGPYAVALSNAFGTATSSVAPLIVVAPPFIATQPQSQTRPVGYPVVSFSVTATSLTAISYQWLKDATDISGATNINYRISPLKANDLGIYAVRVSNFAGATLSSDAVLDTDSSEPTNCFQCPAGVVAWWPGDGNGANLVGANHVTFYSGATNATGIMEQAFRFDGISNYAAAPDNPLLSPHVGTNGEMTLMAWVNITNYPSTPRPFLAKGTNNAWEYALYVNTTGGVRFLLWNLSASATYADTTAGKLNLGQWHHIAGTLKKGQFSRLYVDGVRVAEVTTFGSDTGDGVSPFYMGKRSDGFPFSGLVDEVVLFNRALSSNDLATIYARGSAGLCKDALPPTILSSPTNQYLALAGNLTLTVTASATPPLSYQWRFNGTNLTGATDPTLSIQAAQTDQSGSYSVIVSNAYGTATSVPAVLTVVPPPFITIQPRSQSWPVGYPAVSFTVAATSVTAFAYQWLKNGVDVPGATNTNNLISPLQINDLGTYAVRVSNFAGATLSSDAVLDTDSREPTNCFQCPAGVVAWWPGDGNGANLVGANHVTFYSGATNVTGIVDQAFRFDGISNYAAAPDSPLLSPHVGTNGEMTLMAWVNITNYPSTPRPFLAKGTNNAWEYALYVNTTGGVRFLLWNLSASATYADSTAGKLNLGQWHHVAGTLRKGQFARLYVDGVRVAEVTTFGSDTGDGVSPFYIGKRSDGFPFSGLVDEVVLFNRAVSSDDLATIYARGSAGLCKDALPPTILSSPTNQYLALASNLTLSVTAGGTPPLSYQWLFNGTVLPDMTDSTLVITSARVDQSGLYSVVVSNAYGNAIAPAARINVFPVPIQYPLFLVSNVSIGASDSAYDGRNVVLVGATATIDGFHAFNSLLLTNGAVLQHSPAATNGLRLLVTNDCTIASNCVIRVDGFGYGSFAGPGRGEASTPCSQSTRGAGGAGHGSSGGNGNVPGGVVYGSLQQPEDLGSGGGYTRWANGTGGCPIVAGGSGGGAIRLTVGGTFVLSGNLTANGTSGERYGLSGPGFGVYFSGGGGSGGTIVITAENLAGNGSISANGGNGGRGEAGGGAGGRIALYVTHSTYTGTISARGGSGRAPGGLGTMYTSPKDDILVLSKQMLGRLDTPSLVERWSFTAVAGQQVRLEGINSSAPGIVFDLEGPDGWIGFSNITSQSVLLNLPSSGTYTLTARVVGGGYHGTYTFRLQETVQTNILLGVPFVGHFVGSGQAQLFRFELPSNRPVLVTLWSSSNANRTEIYLRHGTLPTRAEFDFRSASLASPNQTIITTDTYPGTWYVLVYGDAIPSPGDFILEVNSADLLLAGSTPSIVGNSIPGNITIHGAGFTPDTTVSLVNGGQAILASDVSVLNGGRLVADFDFTLISPNTYTLRVQSGTNVAELPFTVTDGGQPKLVTRLIVPRTLGRHAPATIYIEYANVGTVATPAPLLVLTGTQQPILAFAVSLTAVGYQRGFWTSANPDGWSQTLQFLANGASQGILQPGESNTIAVAYAGLLRPWNFSNPSIRFDLGVMTVANPTPVNWAALKPVMRPTGLPAETWDVLWTSFTAQAGATWGDYVRMLSANATYLHKLGLDVKDLHRLLGFSFAQADGLNVIRTLASSTDAYIPTPGLRLSFERFFPQSISGRFRAGALGRGWAHNWEINLNVDDDGTATVNGPGGSRRIFQPDSRTGGSTFFSETGDHGKLTKAGGVFTLTEARGLKRVFASDGKLSYVQDLNTNRITPTYSGNLITRLTHSAGQSLVFNYDGTVLQSVTDSAGRTTTFTYAGDQLESARYHDGSEIRYSYEQNPIMPAGAHALIQVAYPGGTHEFFAYDRLGRLASLSRDGGAESIGFAYPGGGLVNVTDAFANRTRFFLDHRGLLAKVEDPLNHALRLTYDSEFNLDTITDPAGRSHRYDYDTKGNLVEAIDPLGGRTRFGYGALNRLATLTDAKGNLTRYAHTTNGHLNAITYADNSVERWGYDAIGNPTTWTNRRVQRIQYQFNTNGQLTTKLYPDGSRADYRYDPRGNLTSASNYTGRITLDHFANDRLRRITYPGNRWLEYEYDEAGRRTSMTDQLGYRLTYLYDSAGRLRQLTNNDGVRLVLYEYDNAGRLSRKTLGNGVYTTNLYDSAGQLLSLHNRQPDGTLLSRFDYTYDSRSRRTRMDTHYGTWDYEYDDLGQLTHAVLVSTDTSILNQDLLYVYDALGNRVRTVENGVTTEYAVNGMNQYTQVGATTLRYDADGSLTQNVAGAATLLAIANNFENRVIGFNSTNGQRRFDYDALGIPSIFTRDGVRSIQVQDPSGLGDLVTIYDETDRLVQRELHALGLVGTSIESADMFPIFDAIGNLVGTTDSNADSMYTQTIRPFGKRISPDVGNQSSLTLGGEFGVMHEGELMLMRARFYSPELSRFVSPDPLDLAGGDANLYSYVGNDPISFIDPTGLANPFRWLKDRFIERQVRKMAMSLHPKVKDVRFRFDSNGQCLMCGDFSGEISFDPPLELSDRFGGDEPVRNPFQPPADFPGWGNRGKFPGGRDPNLNYPGPPNIPDVKPPTPPVDPAGNGSSGTAAANDPNSLTGPAGYGPQNYLAGDSLFAYRIDFENDTNASAPAQFVTVSDPLPATLDWTTLELTEVAFGDWFFPIPPRTQHYQRTEHLTVNGVNFDVQLEVGLNPLTGVITATFRSIVPTTGLPPGVETGFLPPEDGTGRGQGHISYVIRPKAGQATGTEIRNVASIVFDQQPAIATDLVDPHNVNSGHDTNKQALVTIDADSPTGAVVTLPPTATNSTFTVCWSGSDIGAGITGYDVWVQTNGGPWVLWQANTSETCALFQARNSESYGFHAIAHDGAGNVQPGKTVADTSTVTQPNYPPFIEPLIDQIAFVGKTFFVTNRAGDSDLPSQALTFGLITNGPVAAPPGARVNPTNGLFRWAPTRAYGSTTNLIHVIVSDSGQPSLSATGRFTVVIGDHLEGGIGSAVVLAGESTNVPVTLFSSVPVRDPAFAVEHPAGRFTNVSLLNLSSTLLPAYSISENGGTYEFITLTNVPGQFLQDRRYLGELRLQTLPGQSSAFLPLKITDLRAVRVDGTNVFSLVDGFGRVAIVGEEPMLEASLASNGTVQFVLYGVPGATVRIEWAARLPAESGDWNLLTHVILTDLSTSLPTIAADTPKRFFRAVRQ